MKQRLRQTNGILWLSKPIPADIAEMDAKYTRLHPNELKWVANDYVAPQVEEPQVEEPVEEEEPIAIATAEELLAEEEEDA